MTATLNICFLLLVDLVEAIRLPLITYDDTHRDVVAASDRVTNAYTLEDDVVSYSRRLDHVSSVCISAAWHSGQFGKAICIGGEPDKTIAATA